MVRTVKVNLEADAARYIGPVKESESATEGLDRKVTALDRDINKIPPDAAKAAASMKLLSDESTRVGNKLDDLGRPNRVTALSGIDRQVTSTRKEIRALADEFNKTGDLDVFGKLLGKQSELDDLMKTGQKIVDSLAADGKLAGMEFTKNFSSSLQGAESTPVIGPIVVGSIVAAIVAASPIIGAALNGALLAGVGLGGIAAGVVGQLHDPRIRAEFQGLGHELSQWLTDATVGFKQPLLQAGQIFAGTFESIAPALQKDLAGLAQYVRPLADGIQRLFMNMQPGLDRAFAAAGPILKVLADELPSLGSALNKFFSDLSYNQQGAQEGLRALLQVVEQVIIWTGDLISGLSLAFHWVLEFGVAASSVASKIFGWIPVLGSFFDKIHGFWDSVLHGPVGAGQGPVTVIRQIGEAAALTDDQLSSLNTEITKTKVTTDTLAGALAGKIFNEMMSVDQATLAWHQSLTQLGDTLKQNGLAIDRHSHQIADNTKEGEANRSAILGAVTANMQQYQAQIAAGMSAQDAAKAYDDNTAALERQLRKAGLTQQQIDGLIGKYKQVPDEVNTEIALHGIADAIDRLTNLIGLINDIPGYRQVTIDERHLITTDMGHPQRWGGITEHAATGLLNAGIYSPMSPARYAFAEPATGGEAFIPRHGDYGRSTSILDQAARWYGGRFAPAGASGGSMTNVTVYVDAGIGTNGIEVGRQIAAQLRPFINATGGGNVQVALGRRGQ